MCMLDVSIPVPLLGPRPKWEWLTCASPGCPGPEPPLLPPQAPVQAPGAPSRAAWPPFSAFPSGSLLQQVPGACPGRLSPLCLCLFLLLCLSFPITSAEAPLHTPGQSLSYAPSFTGSQPGFGRGCHCPRHSILSPESSSPSNRTELHSFLLSCGEPLPSGLPPACSLAGLQPTQPPLSVQAHALVSCHPVCSPTLSPTSACFTTC